MPDGCILEFSGGSEKMVPSGIESRYRLAASSFLEGAASPEQLLQPGSLIGMEGLSS